MGKQRQELGNWGEGLAAKFLEKRNYTILARNYRTRSGELDLVAHQVLDGQPCLVFVEVKTRTWPGYGYPEQAVTNKKWQCLLATINDFQEEFPIYQADWRIDVIAIQRLKSGEEPQIVHFENVTYINGKEY